MLSAEIGRWIDAVGICAGNAQASAPTINMSYQKVGNRVAKSVAAVCLSILNARAFWQNVMFDTNGGL